MKIWIKWKISTILYFYNKAYFSSFFTAYTAGNTTRGCSTKGNSTRKSILAQENGVQSVDPSKQWKQYRDK